MAELPAESVRQALAELRIQRVIVGVRIVPGKIHAAELRIRNNKVLGQAGAPQQSAVLSGYRRRGVQEVRQGADVPVGDELVGIRVSPERFGAGQRRSVDHSGAGHVESHKDPVE
jgi:hypothetical protein